MEPFVYIISAACCHVSWAFNPLWHLPASSICPWHAWQLFQPQSTLLTFPQFDSKMKRITCSAAKAALHEAVGQGSSSKGKKKGACPQTCFVFPSTQCYLCLDLASKNKSVVTDQTSDQVSPKGIYKGECFFYHMLLRFIFSGGKKCTSSNVVDDQDTQTSPNAPKRAKDTIYDAHEARWSLHPPSCIWTGEGLEQHEQNGGSY